MRRRSLVAGVVLLSACGIGGSCPQVDPSRALQSGTYQTTDTDVAARKTLQLDRAGGVVTVRYTRAGKAVVERWRIKGITMNSF